MSYESRSENGLGCHQSLNMQNPPLSNGEYPRSRRSISNVKKNVANNPIAISGPFGEFLHNSTIHGFKELGRTKKTTLRRFWITVILMCLVGVSYEIYQVINYYSGKP